MKVAVLAGGESSRMGREKPLLPVEGTPILERVLQAVRSSDAAELSEICLSPNAPDTLHRYRDHPCARVTPGDGYHADLARLLSDADAPRLVLPADLPLLRPEHLDAATGSHRRLEAPVSLVVTTAYKERLGLTTSQKPLEHTGINVLNSTPDPQDDRRVLLDRLGTACNVNTPRDLRVARHLAENGR